MSSPRPTPVVASIPASTPFVGPEALERELGFGFGLRLGANESLFEPSPLAVQAMIEQAARGQFYGDPEGFELRSEIALGHGTTIEHVVLASGIDELLMLFARAFVAPGEAVATTLGSYPTFEYAIRSVGGVFLYGQYRDGFVDMESMGSIAEEHKPKILYLANPDNPSGTWHTSETIRAFRRGIPSETLILLDEAYSDFAPEVPPFDPSDTGLVRLRTFSKGHGMAGIRVGYALCSPEHVLTLNKIRMHFGVSSVAQAGALASLRDKEHLRKVVSQTLEVRRWLASEMEGLGFGSLPSHTNFLTIDIGSPEQAQGVLLELRKKGVFIRKPMLAPLDGHIRVTVGPQPAMEEFMSLFGSVRR